MPPATEKQQPHRLLAASHKAGIRHGMEAIIDIDNVVVHPAPFGAPRLGSVRFCDCVVNLRVHNDGVPDGNPLSQTVVLDSKIRVPRPKKVRIYRLEKVRVTTNGVTELHATRQTRFVRTNPFNFEVEEEPEIAMPYAHA